MDTDPALGLSGLADSQHENARLYQIAGITIGVSADLAITDTTFDAKFAHFRATAPGDDIIRIHHHFTLPPVGELVLGHASYRKPPWAIYRREDSWVYLGIAPGPVDPYTYMVAVLSADHRLARVFHQSEEVFRVGNWHSLTLFPTDQLLLARVLADRQACYLHASGVILNGRGLAFVGHSEAGKSTLATMLREDGQILCDDRVIVRRWPEGFRVHGTWSHGDLADVSGASAPLRAILFLEKATENQLVRIDDPREIARRLPFYVVRPLVTADWWGKILSLVEKLVAEVPAYRLRFDRSGRVVSLLSDLR